MTLGFRRTATGVEVRLSPLEVALLRDLAGQVLGLLRAADRADPVVARLFPDAHRDDPEVAASFRALAEEELRDAKADAARALVASLPAEGRLVLATADAERWLAALNDVRLALGTRLEVTEDTYDELDRLDPDDPRHDPLRVYEWLGLLEETLVAALAESPDPPL